MASAILTKVIKMDAVAWRYFCYFMDGMVSGDLFTTMDVLDYIKSRVKNHTPTKKDVGHMVIKYGNIEPIGYQGKFDGFTVYKVIA